MKHYCIKSKRCGLFLCSEHTIKIRKDLFDIQYLKKMLLKGRGVGMTISWGKCIKGREVAGKIYNPASWFLSSLAKAPTKSHLLHRKAP